MSSRMLSCLSSCYCPPSCYVHRRVMCHPLCYVRRQVMSILYVTSSLSVCVCVCGWVLPQQPEFAMCRPLLKKLHALKFDVTDTVNHKMHETLQRRLCACVSQHLMKFPPNRQLKLIEAGSDQVTGLGRTPDKGSPPFVEIQSTVCVTPLSHAEPSADCVCVSAGHAAVPCRTFHHAAKNIGTQCTSLSKRLPYAKHLATIHGPDTSRKASVKKSPQTTTQKTLPNPQKFILCHPIQLRSSKSNSFHLS